MISAVVKCHLLDDYLLEMTQDAVATIKPFVDELILVDHASPTGSGWLKREADIYLRYDEAKGFPYTAKDGIALANNDYVAVLNNDILFFTNWVEKLMQFKDYALIHPQMVDWGREHYSGDTVKENISPQEGMFFSAFIVNKKIYNDIGGWDTDYDFWGYDDWDFYYRLLEAGHKAVWTDVANYWHKGGATIGRIGRKQFQDKNRELFKQKHGIDPHDVDWSKYADNS